MRTFERGGGESLDDPETPEPTWIPRGIRDLVEPHENIEHPILRRRVRLQQTIVVLLMVLFPGVLVLEFVLSGFRIASLADTGSFLVALFLPVLVAALLLGRTTRPTVGGHLLVWYLMGALTFLATMTLDPELARYILMALPVPVVLASFLLGAPATATVFLAGLGLHVGVPLLRADWVFDLGSLVIFLLITVPVILSAMMSRQALLETTALARRLEDERERARTAETQLREMTEHIQEVFWLTDPEKEEMVYVSPRYEAVWGRPVEDLMDDPREWREAIHPGDRNRVEEQVPLQAEGRYDIRYRVVRPDGSVRWIRDRAFPVRNEEGEVVWLAGVAMDITDQVELSELREAAREEAGRRAELEQVVYVTSHNLQEPLRDINRFSQVLERHHEDALGEEGRARLAFILDGVRRLQERIDALRSYAEVTTNVRSEVVVDVRSMVARVLADLGVEDGVEDVVGHGDLPPVEVDPRQLRSLLHEVLENAYKFHEDGNAPRVRVVAGRDGGFVRYEVRDDGMGIEPRHHERVFRLFERLHPERFPGSGVGLAVARRVVERHGGSMGLESQRGEGTTVWFTLPAPDPDPTQAS